MTSPVMLLATVFAELSLFAVGGANAVVPEMQRHFVDVAGGLDGPLFTSLVAIAQAAPGPNAMIVGLVGWHVAGASGATAATLGFCGPPAIITLLVGRGWSRLRENGIGPVIMTGAAPLTVGLVLASAWALARGQGAHAIPVAITAMAALGAMWKPSAAMWLLALGAGVAVVAGQT